LAIFILTGGQAASGTRSGMILFHTLPLRRMCGTRRARSQARAVVCDGRFLTRLSE